MPPRLKYVEVENFKSFKGHCVIGPLQQFTAVIGPNGSGKSNFMDAISFAMGEKTASLRVKRLSNLVHGASIKKPVSSSASVTARFYLNNEGDEEISFKRSVQGSSSEYKINNNIVSSQEYLAELERLHINVKAKNFLVFQGTVENIAMKSAKEMTNLFEEISGSGALKEEYDNLKQQMKESKEKINFSYQKKKGIAAVQKEAKLETEEARTYAGLKQDLNEKMVEHQLFRLFHTESEQKNLERDLKSKKLKGDKIIQNKEMAEEALKEKKKNQGRVGRELAKMEQVVREVEAEISKKKPRFIKAKEKVSHTQKKLDSANKTLEQARKADEARNKDIKKLETELAEVERAKAEYESAISEESQSQGRDVHLEDEQEREYSRLKDKVAKRSTRYMQELDSVIREQKADQDQLDNLARMRTEADNMHKRKEHEKEEILKRIKKLIELISASEKVLQDKRELRNELQLDVSSSKHEMLEIQKQLDGVNEQMGDAKINKYEDARRKQKQDIIQRFKSNYTGVYGRMINLCQPIDKRYNVAITKVFGKNIDAIVVDSEQTALTCIKYLREQMLEPEVFLPINSLRVSSLKENLRYIKEPKGINLLYDVLKFEPQDIYNAVLFVTNNALICETSEDARTAAYDIGERNNAVALDGTFYRRSGIISGGTLDDSRKAKRWDEKQISQMKARKENLTKELGEKVKVSRQESELNMVNSQIQGTEIRLSYTKADLESALQQIKIIDEELMRLSREIANFVPNIEEIERTMRVHLQQIEKVKLQINSVEDTEFSKFCREIGVRNIRQYEDRELKTQEERKQKRLEYQKQINRITSSLEFEKSRDTQSNVSRWEQCVNKEKETLESFKKHEKKQSNIIKDEMHQLQQLNAETLTKKLEVDAMEEDIKKFKRELGIIAKELEALQKQIGSLENKVESKKSDRHGILMQCKMQDIVIPMTVGNMDSIVQQNTSQSESGDSNWTNVQYDKESRIKIDYELLSNEYKDIQGSGDIKKMEEVLQHSIQSLQSTLTKIKAPNMKAVQKLELTLGKLQSTNVEFENFRKQNKTITERFEKIKLQRYNIFMKCFDHVSNEIDTIYKKLSQNNGAQAFLSVENEEEPYLGGINYNCVVSGKRFLPMMNLSGGEKTVAALALLFAIRSNQPAPFFMLDEVDAALDNTNVSKVTKYIRKESESVQTIAISHKENFFSCADTLVGFSIVPRVSLASHVSIVDLTKYRTL